MNKKIFSRVRCIALAAILFLPFSVIVSQNAGINATGATPNSSAILDLNTGNTYTSPNGKGLLIPNVALTSTTDAVTVTSPATSLLVYNTATASSGSTAVSPGYYYWDGTKWVTFTGSNGKDWALLGNAGTSAATNFMGSTDANDVVFKANSAEVFRMGNSKTNLMVNSTSNTTDFLSSTASNTMNGIGAYVAGTNAKPAIYALSSSTSSAANAIYAEASAAGPAAIYAKISSGTSTAAAMEADGSGSSTANAIYAHTTGSPNYSAIFCYTNPTANGTGFTTSTSNHTLLANVDGNMNYSFGLYGRVLGAGVPSGGTFGLWASNLWGALGYYSTASAKYGAYVNASAAGATTYGNGTGRLGNNSTMPIVCEGIGLGAYGDLFGSWIRGNVYGLAVKGERTSLYVDGKTVVNKPIVELTKSQDDKVQVNYHPVSSSPDLQLHGVTYLQNGKTSVTLDENALSQIDKNKELTIIVTPGGQTNGVYAEVKNGVLHITENSNGNSNTRVSWMIIGTRVVEADFVPAEFSDKDFDKNLGEFMHDENDKNSPIPDNLWWDGSKLNKGKIPQQPK